MKYVYSGEYRQYRGYVFTKDKPVEITDRGTLELIKHEPAFTEVKDEEAEEGKVPSNPEAILLGETHEETKEQETAPSGVLKKFNRSEWMKKMHAEGRMKRK